MKEQVVLRLDIFMAAELRTLLEIAKQATLSGSHERASAERMLDYLLQERWRQVPFIEEGE